MYLKALKATALLSTLLITSGCAILPTVTWGDPVEPEPIVKVVTKTVDKEIVQPIFPRGLELKEPFWYVVSKKNIDEFIARVEKEEGQLVFFAMTPSDYELMAYNMQEIKRYINEMKEVVVYYRTVTQPSQTKEEVKDNE